MNAFVQHFSFEFRTGVRNKNLLLLNYLFPLGFYLMMGFIMVEINPLFQKDLIPAMVVFAVLAATLLGIPDPLVTARESGIFRSYKINGVPAFSILLIPALTTIGKRPIAFRRPTANRLGVFCSDLFRPGNCLQRYRDPNRRDLVQLQDNRPVFTASIPTFDALRRIDDSLQHAANSSRSSFPTSACHPRDERYARSGDGRQR